MYHCVCVYSGMMNNLNKFGTYISSLKPWLLEHALFVVKCKDTAVVAHEKSMLISLYPGSFVEWIEIC